MPPDIRWQQRFANVCQALDQLETVFQPHALNERVRPHRCRRGRGWLSQPLPTL